MRAIVVGGGDKPSKKLIEYYLDSETIIIAADGGANCLYQYEIVPNYLLGDFDSIDSRVLGELKDNTFTERFPIEKDYTDSDLALDKAIEKGATEVVFLGCTGKRLDHFLGNLCVLYKGLKRGIKASIVDENNKLFLVNESTTLKGTKGEMFSLLSYFEEVEGLTIEGAKYPLKNFHLSLGDNLTISNEFEEDEVELRFDSGILMVMLSKDE